MKHFIVLLHAFLCTAFLFAQNNANLTISTTGSSNLKITFANKKYSLQDRSVTFQSLSPGTYSLTIFQLRQKANGGTEYVTVYDKNVTLSAQRHMEVCVLRFGKVTMDEGFIEKDDWNRNYQNPDPSDNRNNGNGNRYEPRPMDAAQFTSIKNTVSSEYSDEDKMRMAKVVLKSNWFSADQLKELCNLFYTDGNKLEFAKYGYDFCTDKGNYFKLAETIYSSTYKRDLLDFLAGK